MTMSAFSMFDRIEIVPSPTREFCFVVVVVVVVVVVLPLSCWSDLLHMMVNAPPTRHVCLVVLSVCRLCRNRTFEYNSNNIFLYSICIYFIACVLTQMLDSCIYTNNVHVYVAQPQPTYSSESVVTGIL